MSSAGTQAAVAKNLASAAGETGTQAAQTAGRGLSGRGWAGLGLGTAATGGLGYYGYKNYMARPSFSSPEDAYKYHMEQYGDATRPYQQALENAVIGGHDELADKLMSNMAQGNYDVSNLYSGKLTPEQRSIVDELGKNTGAAQGSWGITKLLNPWGASQGAAAHQSAAQNAQAKLTGEYRRQIAAANPDAIRARMERTKQLQGMAPVGRQDIYNAQLRHLQKQLDTMPPNGVGPAAQAIAQRMRAAGMPVPDMASMNQGGSSYGTPASFWQLGQRPGYPAWGQRPAIGNRDYTHDPNSYNVWQQFLDQTGQGNGMMRPR
jgi:hypothetical protein